MRAICETCNQVQPPDWQPGNLCTNCGTVVRREKRCHWCVALTPAGKFCRHCGAGQVPDDQYGAARWLKHMGTDQFVLPGRLAALDPEQVEHFTRLYQRHAIVAERHLDDMAYAEDFARQRGWVRAWEQVLLPRLPLPDAELAAFTLPPSRSTTAMERLLEIRQTSPFAVSQVLAALARLRLWQIHGSEADYKELGIWQDRELAERHLQDPDPAICTEAALTLSHWRLVSVGAPPASQLLDALRTTTTFPVEVATSLALAAARQQGKGQPVPALALAAEDDDLAFAAALANYAPDPLLAALRVPLRRYVAARTLTRMQFDFNLAALLPGFARHELEELLYLVSIQERPRPDLRQFLQEVTNKQHGLDAGSRDRARTLLARDLRPGDAARLVSENPDLSFLENFLKNTPLPPLELVAMCRELVNTNQFTNNMLSENVEAQLPFSFIPEVWRTAPATSLQGLRALATQQLTTYADGEALALANFLRAVVWEEAVATEARGLAHRVLFTWYQGYRHPSQVRLSFAPAAAAVYFGSFEAFVEHFTYGLEHLPTLVALDADSDVLRLLETAAEPADAPALLQALALLPLPLMLRLRRALVALARDYDRWSLPRQWAVRTLALLQQHAPWREDVRADLAGLQTATDSTVVYMAEQALAAG
ncbi:hypothetical protein GCM10027422_15400 [Hymenobacter arcticus]